MAAFGYGAGMKRWKGVLGLAIIGAIAAPFVFGTWQPRPNAQAWLALTPERRANLLAKMESSKNCRYLETQVEARDALGLTPDPDDILEAIQCHREQDALRDGGEAQAYFSLPRYLAINAAIALAGFLGVVGVALVLPVLLRRYRLRPTSQS
jgi:hypothetical protein